MELVNKSDYIICRETPPGYSVRLELKSWTSHLSSAHNTETCKKKLNKCNELHGNFDRQLETQENVIPSRKKQKSFGSRPAQARYNWPEAKIVTGLLVFPDWLPTASIFFTTSIPSTTCPKTTCFPSNLKKKSKCRYVMINYAEQMAQAAFHSFI